MQLWLGNLIPESFLALSWPKWLHNNRKQPKNVNESTTNQNHGETNGNRFLSCMRKEKQPTWRWIRMVRPTMKRNTHKKIPNCKSHTNSKIVHVRPPSQLSVWVKFQNLCMRRRTTVSAWGWERMQEFPHEGERVYWWSVHVGKDWQSFHTPLSNNNCPTNIRGFNVVVD